eukprot:Amastigsp_a4003_24.p3 type:complete len:107 gc:universal Amastigsp_a4003_24:1271-951(-)
MFRGWRQCASTECHRRHCDRLEQQSWDGPDKFIQHCDWLGLTGTSGERCNRRWSASGCAFSGLCCPWASCAGESCLRWKRGMRARRSLLPAAVRRLGAGKSLRCQQ